MKIYVYEVGTHHPTNVFLQSEIDDPDYMYIGEWDLSCEFPSEVDLTTMRIAHKTKRLAALKARHQEEIDALEDTA